LSTLKGFANSKSPQPDGWKIEFFLDFFDILGQNILEGVDESRIKGKIIRDFHSTFVTLIPKRDKPKSFDGF